MTYATSLSPQRNGRVGAAATPAPGGVGRTARGRLCDYFSNSGSRLIRSLWAKPKTIEVKIG
jgi:hypothetical protein